MAKIIALFKYDKHLSQDAIIIDTTSGSGVYRELSPFILKVLDPMTNRFVLFENLWQFSKVYKGFLDKNGNPSESWWYWRNGGINDNKAHRYPMGKGAMPEYSFWNGKKLGYIEARKQIYIPEYYKAVRTTNSFNFLNELAQTGQKDIVLLDFDAYDHRKLGYNFNDVVNDSKRKMGHSFILLQMLENPLWCPLLDEEVKDGN